MVDLSQYVTSTINGIKVLDAWEILEKNVVGVYPKGVDAYSDEGVAVLNKWLEENNVHYYGSPKETFSQYEAIMQAKNNGHEYILLEDMS